MAQSQKTFYLALLGLLLVGGYFIMSRFTGGGIISIPANVTVMPEDTSGFRGYVLGSPDAPIEVTEYGDLECSYCQTFATMQFPDVQRRLIATGKIRFRYRDYPLPGHRHPREAAHAAACGNDQGKYWEMQHEIFAQQGDWARKADAVPSFRAIAEHLSLDVKAWDECMRSGRYAGRIQASLDEGTAIGVNSTPTFFLNGRLFQFRNADQLVAVVDSLITLQSAAATQP